MLPFYLACCSGNIETTKYLFELYPRSINNVPSDYGGFTPLHTVLFKCRRSYKIELVKFLLDNDQGAVSILDEDGKFPLHMATEWASDNIVKLVFNARPNAIHAADNHGDTPLDFVRHRNHFGLVIFLEQQIKFERQAHTDRIPDKNGQLPIHRALHNGDVWLGGVKLMLAANQASTYVTDKQGYTPLHVACHVGNLDAAHFLIGVNHNSLQGPDTRGNLPLHLACAGGNCDVISCILEQSTYGVPLQNSDKQTPIELLLFESECDRNSMVFVNAVWYLFQVNPSDTLKCLVKNNMMNQLDNHCQRG